MGEHKQFLMLGGMPVLAHTLRAFDRAASVDEVIIAAREQDILLIWDMISEFQIKKVSKIINGGETRAQSIAAALCEVSDDTEIIAIHDGARPLIEPDLIDLAVSEAAKLGAVTLGVKVKDTIKRIGANGAIVETLAREELYHIQTPQVFRAEIIHEAYAKSPLLKGGAHEVGGGLQVQITDDCTLVERLEIPVHIVEGDYSNIKITTKEDIAIAEGLLCER
jgi:2-C-methyl-D-erythritol 4-phosphate cytidylyltransferase